MKSVQCSVKVERALSESLPVNRQGPGMAPALRIYRNRLHIRVSCDSVPVSGRSTIRENPNKIEKSRNRDPER
jgi:hypothetical protein